MKFSAVNELHLNDTDFDLPDEAFVNEQDGNIYGKNVKIKWTDGVMQGEIDNIVLLFECKFSLKKKQQQQQSKEWSYFN